MTTFNATGRPTVGLAMIVRDVERIIGRCLDSVKRHVDEIVIVDTGSSDQTKQAIAACLDHQVPYKILDFTQSLFPDAFIFDVAETWVKKIPGPFAGKYFLSDFARARQYGFDRCTTDYVLWLDSDDTLTDPEALSEVVADLAAGGHACADLSYDYQRDAQGNKQVWTFRERIVKRGHASWTQPIHEVMVVSGSHKHYEKPVVTHHRVQDKLEVLWHHRNLKVLTWWFENKWKKLEDVDPRNLYYLAVESRFIWPEDALEMFKVYTRRSGWDLERANARIMRGGILEQLQRYDDALEEYAIAAIDFPGNPDGYFGAARCAWLKPVKDFYKIVQWSEKGLEVMDKDLVTGLTDNPFERSWNPLVYYSIGLTALGHYEKSAEICRRGLAIMPNEPHLKGNLKVALEHLAAKASTERSTEPSPFDTIEHITAIDRSNPLPTNSVAFSHNLKVMMSIQIWRHALSEGPERALALLSNLPSDIQSDPTIDEASRITFWLTRKKEPSAHVIDKTEPVLLSEVITPKAIPSIRRSQSIAIWVGPAFEDWSPENLKTGIGGSETATINMARELSKQGYLVTVLGTWSGRDIDVKDGYDVLYAHHERAIARPDDYACDIFVISRQAWAIRYPIPRRKTYVWAHDIHAGDAKEYEADLSTVDGIFALSQWHADFMKSVYPKILAEKFIVTSNGLDLSRFAGSPRKRGNHCIYASSADRGLEVLLEVWPQIRTQVPNASLDVCYGFDSWKNAALKTNNYGAFQSITWYEKTLRDLKEQGVTSHGRIGQKALSELYMNAKVWAYPTNFTETSCISAMEAQAAACVPVTSGLATLNETVKFGTILNINTLGNYLDLRYREAFVSEVVRLLTNDEERNAIGMKARKYALENLSWTNVAKQWANIFQNTDREASPPITFAAFDSSEAITELIPTQSSMPAASPTTEVISETSVAITVNLPQETPPVMIEKEETSEEPNDIVVSPSKLRVAVILGRQGSPIHGVINVRNAYDDVPEAPFMTGTVSGFIQIAWGLAGLGHTVDAFCECADDWVNSSMAGVNFYRLGEHSIDVTYDAYISVNEPDQLRMRPIDKVRIVANWLNDYSFCRPGWDHAVDVYACPSEALLAHIVTLGVVPRSKLKIVPLSFNPELHQNVQVKVPGSIAYCSSPDRGLHHLLDFIPDVRKRVPGAHLKVYYRVLDWCQSLVGLEHLEIGRRAKYIKGKLDELGHNGENGVTLVGPVGAARMARELGSAKILAYPCDPVRFTEGFSVAVLDACAADCIPVLAAVDALPEVYYRAAHFVRGKPSEKHEEWVNAICEMLENDTLGAEVLKGSHARAKELTRPKVALMWQELILSEMEKKHA